MSLTTVILAAVCPECGGGLSLRTNHNDNSNFLGCNKFPECRWKSEIMVFAPAVRVANKVEKPEKWAYIRSCLGCGLTIKTNRKKRLVCSTECYQKAFPHKGKDYPVRNCEQCSTAFKPRTYRDRFCKAECRTTYNAALYRAKTAAFEREQEALRQAALNARPQ